MRINGKKEKRIPILFIVTLSITIVLILLSIVFCVRAQRSAQNETLQYAANRWMCDQSEIRYAHISCFFTQAAGFDYMNILQFSRSLDDKMTLESLKAPDNARLWIDAYSGNGIVYVDSSSNIKTNVTAVGNDYFYFHNIELAGGFYFKQDSIANDRVVINEYLAWALFGSNDIAGREIFISSIPYTVTGVAKSFENEEPLLYMQYDTYQRLDSSVYISTYEIIMPDPITDFALDIVSSLISVDKMEHEIIQNNDRYKISNLFNVALKRYKGEIKENRVIYPDFENNARLTEIKIIRMLYGIIISVILIVITLIITVLYYIKTIKIFFEKSIKTVTKTLKKYRYRFEKKRERKQDDKKTI